MSKHRSEAYKARKREKNKARHKARYHSDTEFRDRLLERQRQSYARRAAKKVRPVRVCQVCANDITHLHGRTLVCSESCRKIRTRTQATGNGGKRTKPRSQAYIARKKARYVERFHTDTVFRERERDKKRKSSARFRDQLSVAVAAFNALVSLPRPLPLPPPTQPHCVVCGIEITAPRRRVTCSKACAEVRLREWAAARYRGVSITVPRLDPIEKMARNRARKKRYRASHPRSANERRRGSDWYSKAIAIRRAFVDLGLMSARGGQQNDSHGHGSDGSEASNMATS